MKKIASYSCVFLAMIIGCSSAAAETQYIECTIQPMERPCIRPDGVGPGLGLDLDLATRTTGSTNWSGYAAVSNLANPALYCVTGVAGYWTVPVIQPSAVSTYVSIWVGIDGFASNTVEQLGTLHEWVNGKQYNYAWFEMYPAAGFYILGFPCEVGDQISASVHYLGSDTFELKIHNYTKGVHTTVPTTSTMSSVALRKSAEWVVEAPYYNGILPLANFDTVTFRQCTCTINGIPGTISNSNWEYSDIYMGSGGTVKATPSALMNFGYRFSVAWMHI